MPTYVLLGATGGIGSATARRLAEAGDARFVLAARTQSDLDALAEDLQRRGAETHAVAADATDYAQVQSVVDAATEQYGGFDGIACCVGSILLKPAHLTSVDEFEQTLRLNLHAAFYTVKAAARPLMKKGGSIVLCSSAVARTGLRNHEAIAAAKGGIGALVQSAAATYGARGVRVNAVAPGLVDTGLSARIVSNPAGLKQSQAMHALGTIGQPDDVAQALAWLLSPESSWVTGQTVGVDGGLGTVRA